MSEFPQPQNKQTYNEFNDNNRRGASRGRAMFGGDTHAEFVNHTVAPEGHAENENDGKPTEITAVTPEGQKQLDQLSQASDLGRTAFGSLAMEIDDDNAGVPTLKQEATSVRPLDPVALDTLANQHGDSFDQGRVDAINAYNKK